MEFLNPLVPDRSARESHDVDVRALVKHVILMVEAVVRRRGIIGIFSAGRTDMSAALKAKGSGHELDMSRVGLIGQTLICHPHNAVENLHIGAIHKFCAETSAQVDLELGHEVLLVLIQSSRSPNGHNVTTVDDKNDAQPRVPESAW